MTTTESDAAPRKGLKILFIGNSYTQSIRRYFTGLANAGRTDAYIEWSAQGGVNLSQHAEDEKVIELVSSGDYNVVVLQEQSQLPTLPDFNEKYLESLKKLNKMIKDAGAETVLYMTWGYKRGDEENSAIFPDDTYEKMQERLIKSYETLAEELDATVAPVGIAWSKLTDKMSLYRDDMSHPNSNGAYLASCVLYYTIFHSSPTSIAYKGDVNEDLAKIIRETAATTVEEYTKR